MFSEEQLEQLRSFPDIGRDDLIRYFTLTQADMAFVDPGRGRGPADRLGLAVQLCTLPWLGFVPDEVSSAPPVAVARLAERLGLDPEVLEGYGRRSHTRSDHLLLVAKYLSWKSAPAGGGEMKELEQFLLDRAMEHDSPTLLFNLATEFLMSVKTIRPGVSILERMIISARTGATALTSELVGHLLTGQRCSDLDRLLVSDAGLGMTRLAWLTKPAVEATASAVLTAVGKLTYLRNLDAHTMDLSILPAERRRFLATVGRRSTVQALMRREERRYPILLALVAQSAVDQLDEVIALFDQAVSARESRARTRTDEELAERAKKGESRQLLMDVILPVLADPSIPDEQVGGLLRERIGMSVLRDVAAGAWKPLAKDHGRLSAMDSSYSYLRQFTPGVLAAVDFTGGPGRGTAKISTKPTVGRPRRASRPSPVLAAGSGRQRDCLFSEAVDQVFRPKASGSLKSERGLASENESSLKLVSRPWAVRRLDHLHPAEQGEHLQLRVSCLSWLYPLLAHSSPALKFGGSHRQVIEGVLVGSPADLGGQACMLRSSPGVQPSASQMAVSVLKRIARAWPFLRMDRFTTVTPTREDSSTKVIPFAWRSSSRCTEIRCSGGSVIR